MGCIKDALPYDEPDGKGVGAWARLEEASMGKDTTIGHWEIAGIISPDPMPTYPNGFPEEVISEFEEKTGRKALCNKHFRRESEENFCATSLIRERKLSAITVRSM